MKAILEFNLDDKEDLMAHKRAVKSLDMACALFDIDSKLKKNVENRIECECESFDVLDVVFKRLVIFLKITI